MIKEWVYNNKYYLLATDFFKDQYDLNRQRNDIICTQYYLGTYNWDIQKLYVVYSPLVS